MKFPWVDAEPRCDITADDFELAEAARACTPSQLDAIRMLRDECGWPLRKSLRILDLLRLADH